MIEIVRADLRSEKHADAILQLMDEYARDPMGGGKALPAQVKANLVGELAKRDTVHVVLAFAEGEPAGLAICLEGFSTFLCKPLLNIHDVVVAGRHRGRGVSRLLFGEVEAIAAELGCCKLTLEVLEGNTVARTAYQAFGFAGYELDPRLGKAMFWEKKLPLE